MKKIVLLTLTLLSLSSRIVVATSGCCSGHGGVDCSAGPQSNGRVVCNDGSRTSSCLYSEMSMCGGSSGATTQNIVINDPTSNPTPNPSPRVITSPKPSPVTSPKTSPSPIVQASPETKLESTPPATISPTSVPVQSTESSGGAGPAILGLGVLGGTGWLGYKGIRKLLSQIPHKK